jgi:DNA polymerase-3 subunit beta
VTATTQTRPGMALSVRTDRGTLLDALVTVGLAVPARPALPVLAGVLLGACDGDLIVSATDYSTAVTVRVPGAATGAGRVLVSHAELVRLLDALTKGTRKRDADRLPVDVTTDDVAGPVVRVGGYAVPLECLPVADYPARPAAPPTVASVDREMFATDAARVLVAANLAATALPALSGVRVEVNADAVMLAATDRYRLAVARVPATSATVPAGTLGAVISGRVLASLVGRLTADTVGIGIGLGSFPLVSFTCGHVTITTTAVSDDFPNYAEALPTESTGTLVVNRGQILAEARRAVAVLSAKRVRDAVVALSIRPGSVTLVPALFARAGQVTAPSLPAQTEQIDGAVEYLFAPALLVDALESFAGESVTAHLTGGVTRPVLFTDTPSGLHEPAAFRHLVMPRRPPN